MSYTPTVFNNGTAPGISAEELNKIGNGIKDAHDAVSALDAAANVRVIDRVISTTTVYNTTDETTVYSKAIAGGSLGANGALRLRLGGSMFQDADPSATFTLRVKFGSTTVITIDQTVNDLGTTDRYWQLDVLLQNTTTAGQRVLASWLVLGTSAIDRAVRVEDALATEDTSAQKTLSVTMQFGTGGGLQRFQVWQGVLELIRPAS